MEERRRLEEKRLAREDFHHLGRALGQKDALTLIRIVEHL
jgi:hypothetical protein